MTNVIAQIDLFENETINLNSDFAKYNTLNLNTNFNKNVILKYKGHKINSENMDLSFEENFVWVYNNVVYKSTTNQIFADRLEIDLITKDSKIFMNDNKKIKIIGK
jgi:lipopolysaccharide assembly outer membrane protein LptD (OstA)